MDKNPVPADVGTDCTRRLAVHGGRRIEPAMGHMKMARCWYVSTGGICDWTGWCSARMAIMIMR